MPQQGVPDMPRGTVPSQFVPTTSPQPFINDTRQSLQARNLRQQLEAFELPKPIKHGEHVLCEPSLGENVHIVSATGNLVPQVLLTSLPLFLEITLLKISHSESLNVNRGVYIPADIFFLTLAQLRIDRPHLKAMVASIESRLAYTCIQALKYAKIFPTHPFHDHQEQYCLVRLAIAVYTSSIVILEPRPGIQEEARLQSWRRVQGDGKFELTLRTDGQRTVQKLVRSKYIYSQKADKGVKLASVEDEAIFVERKRQRTTYYIDPEQEFRYSSSDKESEGEQLSHSRKRRRVSTRRHDKKATTDAESGQWSIHSDGRSGRDSMRDDVLDHTGGDTEPLETGGSDNCLD